VTTYTYPAEAIVRRALHVMRQRVEQPNAPPIKVSVRGELIVRESTVGPQAADGQ
jgi:DNA-binding LacI/PurR family transcriptional regulator